MTPDPSPSQIEGGVGPVGAADQNLGINSVQVDTGGTHTLAHRIDATSVGDDERVVDVGGTTADVNGVRIGHKSTVHCQGVVATGGTVSNVKVQVV